MEEVEVVVAHQEHATVRVGDVFLKIDADQTRTDVEIEAMAVAPIPTPRVLWHSPPVLALAALARAGTRRDRFAPRPRTRVARHERRASRRPDRAEPPVAEAALRPWTPRFTHGDLQVSHVFVDGDEITGVIDWSGAGQDDAL